MEYAVVAFRSRSHTIKFYNITLSQGLRTEIVNTPKEAGVGCGLAVKCSLADLARVKTAVRLSGLSSFAGVFSVKNVSGGRIVRSI